MWDLPGPGIEPMSPALAGGFLTTAPPGKSKPLFLEAVTIQEGQRSNSQNHILKKSEGFGLNGEPGL